MLLALREQALQEARAKKDYADARGRDTPIDILRFAFLVTEGRHGHVIYIDDAPDRSSTLSGYGLSDEERAEIDRLRIPHIDKRPIPAALLVRVVVSAPMAPCKPDQIDPPPWTALSSAPLPVLAAYYERFGARVGHIEADYESLAQVTGFTPNEAEAFSAYCRGDELALFQAMSGFRTVADC